MNAEETRAGEEGPPPELYPATVWVDRAGIVRLWSAKAEALLGYPAKEVCGTPAMELLTTRGDREEAPAGRARPEAGRNCDGVLALRHRDGHEVTPTAAPSTAPTPAYCTSKPTRSRSSTASGPSP
ncbi:PAS domain-containing protein [Streptomyces sp. NPDC056488]|uniref:PAS domain-containing protein n=1 Tax=unclassified Streptomyces TaxID=2593676 RepID=UPI00368AEB69